MGAYRNAEDIDGPRERDRCLEPAQLAPELSHSLAGRVALVRWQFAEALTNVSVAELSRRAHFLVDVKEELAAGLKLAIETANGVTRVRRMMKHAIGDDEVKVLIRKRRIHKVGLHHRAVREVARILECGEGRIRNVQRVHCAAA